MGLGDGFKDFYCGDTVRIIVSNKPYIDLTVPPDLNDYRNAECTNIKIYNPRNQKIVDSALCQIADRPGWYTYCYRISCSGCVYGIYRVEITLQSTNISCCTEPTTGSPGISGCDIETPGTTGTSGTPSNDVCSDTTIEYFRVISKESF
jgi:hypothetical protein